MKIWALSESIHFKEVPAELGQMWGFREDDSFSGILTGLSLMPGLSIYEAPICSMCCPVNVGSRRSRACQLGTS